MEREDALPISLTMPLQEEAYVAQIEISDERFPEVCHSDGTGAERCETPY